MSDQCGEATAAAKLAALTFQDRSIYSANRQVRQKEPGSADGDANVEYFEFKEAQENKQNVNWVNEFNQEQKPIASFPDHWNRAFETAALQSRPHQWTAEFSTGNFMTTTSNDGKSFAEDLEKFNQIFVSHQNIDWSKEFAQREEKQWINEYVENENKQLEDAWEEAEKVEEDPQEIADSAQKLLQSLDLSDEKLAGCKFVAYLRQLAGGNDTELNQTNTVNDYSWKHQYMESMKEAGLDEDPQDKEWMEMEKMWDKYEFSGMGYGDFAKNELSQYHLSRALNENPFYQTPVSELKEVVQQLRANKSHSDLILALEALTAKDQNNQEAWKLLGLAQSENEMDVQAIAALLQATRLNPEDDEAWLGLAAACVNEYCIPDALAALESVLKNNTPQSWSVATDKMDYLMAAFQNPSLFTFEKTRLLGQSVLLNLADRHNDAISVLQEATRLYPQDFSIWNRLGATLANSKQYNQAIEAYEVALGFNPNYARGFYNMAISFLNTGDHAKAMGLLVRALELHVPVAASANDKEAVLVGHNSIWNTARVVADMWGQQNVVVMAEERDLNAIKNYLRETQTVFN